MTDRPVFDRIGTKELLQVAETVKNIDWKLLNVILRVEDANFVSYAAVKRFLMAFSPGLCVQLIDSCLSLITLMDSAARILYDTAEAQHFNVDDARLVLRQMDELVGLPELA